MTKRRAAARADVTEVLDPTPPPSDAAKGPIRLTTADEIRVEMAKVYRLARRGQMPTDQATKLTYILGELRKALELSVIERRIQQLERDHEALAHPTR